MLGQVVNSLEPCYDCEEGLECNLIHKPSELFSRIRELTSYEVIRCACCAIINTSSSVDMDKDLCLNCGMKGAWQILDRDDISKEKPFSYQDVVLKINKPESWEHFYKDLEQFYLRYFSGNEELVRQLTECALKLYLDISAEVLDVPQILDYLVPCPRLARLFRRGLITSYEMWSQQMLKDYEL